MRIKFILIIIVAVVAINGCSGTQGNPVTGIYIDGQSITDSSSSHHTWGLWQFIAEPETGTLEIIQLRSVNLHLNALPFLEPPALTDLTVENIQFNGNIIDADIGLRHPFLGLNKFTGFDVCGILISNGSLSGFDDTSLILAGDGDTRILNPDGYTRWWNSSEFPINNGTIFSYTDGLLGRPDSVADFNSTLNAYKYFCDDLGPNDPLDVVTIAGRGMFSAGQKNIRHYTIKLGTGGLVFNYAVDATWQFPQNPPPYDVPDDFGAGANRSEPWNISVTELSNTLWSDGAGSGGDLSLAIDVYDHFNAGMNTVRVESPGHFDMNVSDTPMGGGIGYSTYEVDITNATPSYGSIDLLIAVECEESGYGGLLPGVTQAAYFIYSAPVGEETSFEGEIIFMAPGPPDPFGMSNSNVYHLDLETMIETQLTFITGTGMAISTPRLNPTGSHWLYSTGPSGYITWLSVNEVGGFVVGTTPGPYDCTGCFHPDGVHILSASAVDVFETPYDLISWKYDGTEETLIATGTESIRNPRWCPDEIRIAMTYGLPWGPDNDSDICIYDVNTEAFTEIFEAPGVEDNASWSPVQVDGHYLIAFESNRAHHPDLERDIYVVNPDTEEILCHLDTGVSETHPSFSPDGLSFIFSMQEEDQDDTELYIYYWKVDGLYQVTDDDTYDDSPSWGWDW